MPRAEAEANRVVWEDRPVTIRFADADEAATLPLRKESKREGVLRLIDVEDFDVSACGGTHVARTGAIGIIAVAAFEKFKGGTRLEFLCGGRALAGYHALRDSVAASVRLLSVLPAELPRRSSAAGRRARPAAADQGSADAARWPRSRRRSPERAEPVGRPAWSSPRSTDGTPTVSSPLRLRLRPGRATSRSSSAPRRRRRSSSRGRRMSALDSAAILKQLTATFGGKGGGRPELAQGGGLKGDVERDARRRAN